MIYAPLTLPSRKYCPNIPTAKQLAFLLCPRLEVFFGGAAGPGKTEGLLMGALQYVEQPLYRIRLWIALPITASWGHELTGPPLSSTIFSIRDYLHITYMKSQNKRMRRLLQR
jgi:hypothetical protein